MSVVLNLCNDAYSLCNIWSSEHRDPCLGLCEKKKCLWDTDLNIESQSYIAHCEVKYKAKVNEKEGAEACVPTDFSVQACSLTTLKPATGYMAVKVGGSC